MRVKVRSNFLELAKDGREHPGLRANTEYYVLEVNSESYRVISHQGEPILYPKVLFDVVDRAVPVGWQFQEYPDGEYFLDPASLGRPGFYEQWFCSDGDIRAQQAARLLLREELLRQAMAADDADRTLINDALKRLPAG